MDPHVTGSHRGRGEACRKAQRRWVGWSAVEWTGAQEIPCISNCRAKRRGESQTCEMLQHRDSSKRGNDVEQGGSPQGKEHCRRSGDLRDENDTSQILQTESFTFRLAACRHTGPVLWRALRMVSGSMVAVLKFLISF